MRRCVHEYEFKRVVGSFFQRNLGNSVYGEYFYLDFLCHRDSLGRNFGSDGRGKYSAE